MASKLNAYKVLGLTPDCTMEEIKKAYKKKARENHPDINSDVDAPRKFKIITKAYKFLKEKHTTKESALHEQKQSKKKTKFIIANVPVSIAINGGEIPMDIEVDQFCDECGGSGSDKNDGQTSLCLDCAGSGKVAGSYGIMRVQKTCETCNGTGSKPETKCSRCMGLGTVKNLKTEMLKIPKNAKTGEQIHLQKSVSETDNRYENLVFSLNLISDDYFSVNTLGDITYTQKIDPISSILGGTIHIEHLNREVAFEEYTPPGFLVLIPEEGLKWWDDKNTNFSIQYKIEHTKKLSASQMEALKDIIKR